MQNDSANTDVYAAPAANLDVVETPGQDSFFIASRNKFLLMGIMTFNLYIVYWFYASWNRRRLGAGEKVLPVIRTILMVFYTLPLCRRVADGLKARGSSRAFDATGAAIPLIVITLVKRFISQLTSDSDPLVSLLLDVGLIALVAFLAWRIQDAANEAGGDATGSSNATLTVPNFIWLALFGLGWLGLLAGVVVPAGGQ